MVKALLIYNAPFGFLDMIRPYHNFTVHRTQHGINIQNKLLQNSLSDNRKGDIQLRGMQNPPNRRY